MCLDMRFEPEVEKKMIAELPDGLITVYKHVAKKKRAYYALRAPLRFRVGINVANTSVTLDTGKGYDSYDSGYHSLKTDAIMKRYAELNTGPEPFIKFQIRKQWITAIGKQSRCVVYVTDRIISPSLKDKSAVVE